MSPFIDVPAPHAAPGGLEPGDAWRIRLLCPCCRRSDTVGETARPDRLVCEVTGTLIRTPAWLASLPG